jgi:phosphorylcholine metabolism protein LicD
MRNEFQINAEKDLQAIRLIFAKEGVDFYLAYGTCLGAVRDKDFIAWDDDIDIGVIKCSLEKRIQIGYSLEDLGFVKQNIVFNVAGRMRENESGYQGDKDTGIIVMERNVKITIFFFTEYGNEMICRAKVGSPILMGYPKKLTQHFEKITFKNYEYNIPKPATEYLGFIYSNWRNEDRSEHGKLYSALLS